MKVIFILSTAFVMAIGISAANRQSEAGGPQNPGTVLPAGSTISAVLEKPLDAATAKKGDRVIARTSEAVQSGGQVTIPKGVKLTGHVTEVKRKSGDEASSLGIAFDRLVAQDGTQKPLHVEISTIGRPENASPESMPNSVTGPSSTMGGTAASRAGVGGAGGERGGAAQGTAQGAHGPENTPQHHNAKNTQASEIHKGVVGLPGLTLEPNTHRARGSVISSKTSNVRLASGTRLLLKVVSSGR